MSKAQVSVEYAMIMGFIVLITIPLIMIYYDNVASSNEEIVSRQVNQISQKIVDAAETVYYLGEPSQTTLKVHIPAGVTEVTIGQKKEIIFRIRATTGISDIVQVSSVNITGSLPSTQGIYRITLKAQENEVLVSYT